MPTGKICAAIIANMPASSANASLGALRGGTTIKEQIPTWDFDDTTVEYHDFLCEMESYDGGGLTITLKFGAAAAANDVRWEAAIRRIGDDIEDVDTTNHTYAFNSVTALVPSVIGEIAYNDITFTDGADMDSVADKELFILRVRRLASDAADDLVGDAQLISVLIRET